MVNENTIEPTNDNKAVLDALSNLQQGMQQLHNRIGYLERTGNKGDPAVSNELTGLRQEFRGLASKMDEVVMGNMTEDQQIAYLKQKLQEREETPAPKTEQPPEPRPVSEISDPNAYYARAVEPDILDAAYDEKLISTSDPARLTDEERETLRKLGPRMVVDPTIDGFQAYKRAYIKNIKAAAEKGEAETPPRQVGQTTRPIGSGVVPKLRLVDLTTMTPEEVAANKGQVFAQMGI